jgi:hypothetical protein
MNQYPKEPTKRKAHGRTPRLGDGPLAEAEEIRDYLLALMMLTEASNLRQLRYHYEVDHFNDQLNVGKTGIFPTLHQATTS